MTDSSSGSAEELVALPKEGSSTMVVYSNAAVDGVVSVEVVDSTRSDDERKRQQREYQQIHRKKAKEETVAAQHELTVLRNERGPSLRRV